MVQYDLKLTYDDIKRKEDEHSNQKNNNVDMLKKCLEEKDRLHTKVINLENKVKEQEKQLKHSVIADFTTLGESHLYGLPLSLCRLLRPLGPFFVL